MIWYAAASAGQVEHESLVALASLSALIASGPCLDTNITWKAIPLAAQFWQWDVEASAWFLAFSVDADVSSAWYLRTKTFLPFVWDDAVALLLDVAVAGAAYASTGNDSAATAPSATTPERGRRIKSLILDSISILSFLRDVPEIRNRAIRHEPGARHGGPDYPPPRGPAKW